MTNLHVVPTDPNIPYPVTLARLEAALRQATGSSVELTKNGARFNFNGMDFIASFVRGNDYVSIRSSWETHPTSHAVLVAIYTEVNAWNREHYFPTMYWRKTPRRTLNIVADTITSCRHGLSNLQLHDEVAQALSCDADALQHVQWVVQKMDQLK